MHYYGGKYRTGREISEILKKLIKGKKIKGYIEPFCGALGVLKHMTDEYYQCYASDGCEDLILLWKEVQEEKFKKPNMNEELWYKLKYDNKSSSLRGFAGFGSSYCGRWFSTYANKYFVGRDQNEESYNAIMKIQQYIKDVKFYYKDYKTYSKKLESGGYLVYCDPPYEDSGEKYNASKIDFNTLEFWETVRLWKKYGNIVVVSERKAPKDFKCIWKKKLSNIDKSIYQDKLFI